MHPNTTLGPGSFFIDKELLGTSIPEFPLLEIDDDQAFTPIINSPLTRLVEFELESTTDTQTFGKLVGETPDSSNFSIQYGVTCLEQIRRHKKKRINKKWAKRYGYREIPCIYTFDNARLSDAGDGSIEFTTDSMRIEKEI